MAITLSNNYVIDFCASSGALGFDGRGWPWEWPLRWIGVLDPKAFTIVAKTVTIESRKGNLSWWHPWTSVKLLSNQSVVNAIGLTNPGIYSWVAKDLKRGQSLKYNLAASISVSSIISAAQCVQAIHMCEKLPFVEVNISCPNINNDLKISTILEIFQDCGFPLVLKLGIHQINEEFIKSVDSFVEVYHAINSVPWYVLYPDKKSPLNSDGGLSGRTIKKIAIDAVSRLKRMTSKSIIGGGGIMCLDDVWDFEVAGASAFSIGSCFLLSPWRPNQIVEDYNIIVQGKW